jgi:nucleoside-diphosphate-sugar epimerase
MKFLVLGSAGLIGSALCQYLRDIGHTVITFDLADSIEQDLRIPNNKVLVESVADCDFVFFLAWDVGGSKYLSRRQEQFSFVQNNLAIMYNVFDILSRTDKPFLFTSSQMSEVPKSVYGLTKLLAEQLSKSLDSIVVKLWNVYGYEPVSEKSHVVTDFVCQALETGRITMLTDGQEQRQFLYVRDCVECLYILSQKYDILARNVEYHISSFEWTSISHIAAIIKEIMPDVVITPGNSKDVIQSGNKIQPDNEILHYWTPSTDLKLGIKKLIARYK